jgi:hypothetical protein
MKHAKKHFFYYIYILYFYKTTFGEKKNITQKPKINALTKQKH